MLSGLTLNVHPVQEDVGFYWFQSWVHLDIPWSKVNHILIHTSRAPPGSSYRTSANNWQQLICMLNGSDIYLNLISLPHTVYCRLLSRSHINPLTGYYAVHDVAHARWIFILMAFLVSRAPPAPPLPPSPRRRASYQRGAPRGPHLQPWSPKHKHRSCWGLKTMSKTQMPSRDQALSGREEPMVVAGKHKVTSWISQGQSWHRMTSESSHKVELWVTVHVHTIRGISGLYV